MKIKSIIISDQDLSTSDVQFLSKVFTNITTETEEYDPKNALLKRPDGSLITEPPEGTETVQIRRLDNKYTVQAIKFRQEQKWLLMLGLFFLPEDKDLAEKKAEMLTKQLEIQFEIDRLNAEEIQAEYFYQYYWLDRNNFNDKIFWTYCGENKSIFKRMSELTAQKILAKYSQGELKQYLGIIE